MASRNSIAESGGRKNNFNKVQEPLCEGRGCTAAQTTPWRSMQ